MRTVLAGVAISILLMQPVSAQTTSASPPQDQTKMQDQSAATQNTDSVRQRLRKSLQDSGFTDIQMMPSSFTVRAKDRDGNPVMMVINPDSVTAVTEINNPDRQNSTTGSGSSETNQSSDKQ